MTMDPTGAEHGFHYWAFISYSSVDSSVAKRLHRNLETYRIPRDLVGRPGRDGPTPGRLFPIFRDRDELPLSADLGGSIEAALRASRFLIVLCSPHAVRSRWVNEEIRYYKALGRSDRVLALIIDGEPNASDRPGAEDQECFPRALRYDIDPLGQLTSRRVEPIAGDIRKTGDGWSSAFLKVVAGISGLGFDAFRKREERRQRWRHVVAAAVAASAAAAGAVAWDYNRVKVRYYANVSSQWGIPVGVGELGVSNRKGRFAHYRIESSRRKVRRVERFARILSQLQPVSVDDGDVQEIFYRENGSIDRIDLRDAAGRLIVQRAFSELEMLPGGAVHYVQLRVERGAQMNLDAFGSVEDDNAGHSEISGYEIRYDDLGRVAAKAYRNSANSPRALSDGTFGVAHAYDGSSILPAKEEFFAYTEAGEETPIPNRNGVQFVQIERTRLGDEKSRKLFGSGEAPSDFHFHSRTRMLDEFGNVREESYWSSAGQPVLSPFGCHRATLAYIPDGNQLEEACWGATGEPDLNMYGYHVGITAFNERGNIVSTAYFGKTRQPVWSMDGFHKLTAAYDGRGLQIRAEYWGVDGQPATHANGFHAVTKSYDERGNQTEEAYRDVNGRLVPFKGGVPIMTMAYDRRDNQTRLTAWMVDDEGNVFAVGTVRMAYDERGNLAEKSLWDSSGEPRRYEDGFHKTIWSYDSRGNKTEESYWDVGDQPAIHKDGFHLKRWSYDKNGNMTEESYWSVDQERVGLRRGGLGAGYHRLTRRYDARGNVTESAYWSETGEPASDPEGYHRLTATHDERGNPKEVTRWRTGILGPTANRVIMEYDHRSNVVDESFWDARGEPTCRSGFLLGCDYHRATAAYDERGNQTEETYWGVDGEATTYSERLLDDWKYHQRKWNYDERGRLVAVEYWGADGNPTLRDGYHRVAMEHDELGNVVSETYWGTAGQPTVSNDGAHRVTYIYDIRGNRIELSYWDAEGRPSLHKSGGYHKVKSLYDGRGKEIEVSLWGVAGQPALYNRYHRMTVKYDWRGNEVEKAYWNAQNEPAVLADGSHRLVTVHNDVGTIIDIRLIDREGRQLQKESRVR